NVGDQMSTHNPPLYHGATRLQGESLKKIARRKRVRNKLFIVDGLGSCGRQSARCATSCCSILRIQTPSKTWPSFCDKPDAWRNLPCGGRAPARAFPTFGEAGRARQVNPDE